MVTSGDRFLKDKLLSVGGKGLFVKELEEALLDKRADLAVHSMKDVPVQSPPGLVLSALCTRDNPLDAFISATHTSLATLPIGARVGTASLRRQSQLLHIRPDLQIDSLRGNIQTRLERLHTQSFDAIILAAAGLERMGLNASITEILTPDIMLPACGQGVLGLQCREEDDALQDYISPLHDPMSGICVQSERQVNALLGGNCHIPLAVFCTIESDSSLYLRARVATAKGDRVIDHAERGPQSEASILATRCANVLLDKGAAVLLAS
jgi:hydroxymethylbilane synthase